MSKFFASRNAAPSAGLWKDEDIAMAHDHWGPFESVEDAREALISEMRQEADALEGFDMIERAEDVREAAETIKSGELSVTSGNVIWKISNTAW